MFLRLCQTGELIGEINAKDNAIFYINRAKQNARRFSRSRNERCAFLCGNAGIYAVAAAVSRLNNDEQSLKADIHEFRKGFEACKPIQFSKYGGDEVLVGRAGFLSGVYWLNDTLRPAPFAADQILEVCDSIVVSGRQYSKERRSPFPLMYQYHSTEYLGAAHGLCAILHMLLESPWFSKSTHSIAPPSGYFADIKSTIDAFVGKCSIRTMSTMKSERRHFSLALQDGDGNFPCDTRDATHPGMNILVHWCHGAPGAIYLLAKAYLHFREERYLHACIRASDLIWRKGLLLKGPGICHGVAGNAYAFLIMHRLTGEMQYLYRASRFGEFLKSRLFEHHARTPDYPFSLFEGLAGTVSFLVDLLHPAQASFPFMDIFHSE